MKTVLITGAASGLGLEITKIFLNNGWNVILADLDENKGKRLEQDLQNQYGKKKLFFHKTDVSNELSVANLYQYSIAKYQIIDAIINNAGIFTKGALHEITEKDWNKVMSVNLKSIYLTTKHFIPQMIQNKSVSLSTLPPFQAC